MKYRNLTTYHLDNSIKSIIKIRIKWIESMNGTFITNSKINMYEHIC